MSLCCDGLILAGTGKKRLPASARLFVSFARLKKERDASHRCGRKSKAGPVLVDRNSGNGKDEKEETVGRSIKAHE
ncbi:MAG: hypothetical protein RSA84_03680 [Acinetobacter sp.]